MIIFFLFTNHLFTGPKDRDSCSNPTVNPSEMKYFSQGWSIKNVKIYCRNFNDIAPDMQTEYT